MTSLAACKNGWAPWQTTSTRLSRLNSATAFPTSSEPSLRTCTCNEPYDWAKIEPSESGIKHAYGACAKRTIDTAESGISLRTTSSERFSPAWKTLHGSVDD